MNFLFSTPWAWALPCLLLLIALPVLWYVMARFAMVPGLHQLVVTGAQDFTPCGLADQEDNRPSQSTPARPGPRDDPIGVCGNGGSASGTAALPGQYGGPLGTAALPVDVPALGKSPEQICYEAYRGESHGYRPAWDCLPLSEQMAWKAAAEAVIAEVGRAYDGLREWLYPDLPAVAGFTTEAQRGTEDGGSPASDYCAGPDDPVIPPHHTGHVERV